MNTISKNNSSAGRLHLGDLEEPVAALTGDFDGSDLPDTPIPLTIVLIIVAA